MIFFAPLQGYTEAFYRNAHADVIGGIDEYYTPFLRLEKGTFRTKDLSDIQPERNRSHSGIVPQLLVRTKEEIHIFAEELQLLGYRRIDLNFGCPYIKAVRQGYGAGILKTPERIADIMKETERFPQIGFSIKMRLPAIDLHPLFNSFRLTRIVLHPRTCEQQYQGMPDHAAFLNFESKSIHPVVFNGDILSAEEAKNFHDVMIGRGLLRNPLLSQEIRNGMQKKRTDILRDFHRALVRNCNGMEQPLQKLKTVWDFFLPDTNKHFRKKILKSRTAAEYTDAVEAFFSAMTDNE